MTDDNISRRYAVLAKFEELGVQYEITEHPAVYNMEEVEKLGIDKHGLSVKNLFLRDAKGRKHFLIVLHKDKQANLSELSKKLDSTSLSFASAERMMRYLGLRQGEVSPLGVLNDAEAQVVIVLDKDITGNPKIGVHPNDNTATVWLFYDDLYRFIKSNGNQIIVSVI